LVKLLTDKHGYNEKDGKVSGSRDPSVGLKGATVDLRGKERILIVDDDRALLGMVAELLHRFGYAPMLAESGEKAVEIVRSGKEKIDPVILDLSMPGMGGQGCLTEMISMEPKLKVVVASGYSSSRKVKDVLECGAVGFIAKPYHYNHMLKVVRDCLDGGKSPEGRGGAR